MHNTTRFVAKTHGLDVEAFNAFALKHKDKYSIYEDAGLYWVSNWFVDDLVRDFEDSQEFKAFKESQDGIGS